LGGDYADGVLFGISTTGDAPKFVYSFGGKNGSAPRGSLTLSPDGSTLYGLTSAGGDFSLALLDNATVVAWGDNNFGQLDVPSSLANVTAISAGVFHAIALRAGGDVVAWGGGQKRGESHPWRLVDFKAVAAGEGFSLALRAA
jgi:alpha-tubulin suppressor-like RCC1 family protein